MTQRLEQEPDIQKKQKNPDGETIGVPFRRNYRGVTIRRTERLTIVGGHAARTGVPLVFHIAGEAIDGHTIKCVKIAPIDPPVFGQGVTEVSVATDGHIDHHAVRETIPEILREFEVAKLGHVAPEVGKLTRWRRLYWFAKRVSSVGLCNDGNTEAASKPVLPGNHKSSRRPQGYETL